METVKLLDYAGLQHYDSKMKAYIAGLIADAKAGKVTLQTVSTLPQVADAKENVIYLVPNSGSGSNVKDEFLLIDGKFELIGTTEIDISGKQDVITDLATIRSGAAAGATAVQPADLVAITDAEIDALFQTAAE